MNSNTTMIETNKHHPYLFPSLPRVLIFLGLFLVCWLGDTTLISIVSPTSSVGVAIAQEQEKPQKKRKTVRTPAMREKVYKRLASAQELAENKEFSKAMSVLNDVKGDDGLNCYEIAMTWNFIAYVNTVQEKYNLALPAYKNILKQECIPEALEQQTLFAISQMYLATDKPHDAITYLKRWFTIAPPNSQAHSTLGQCYYLVGDYKSSVIEVGKAVALSKKQGGEPREQWLLLLRAGYYELDNMPKVAEILEELVRLYPKGQYFQQLSGIYGELGQETRQTLVLEASYDGGYFNKSGEYVALTSLLLNSEVPYKAAKVMEEGINKEVVDEKINNLKLLAQAWRMAQEPRDSIRVLKKAAKISDDGQLYITLGQSYMDLDEWTACVEALRSGIKKGGLKKTGPAYVSLGVCLFNTDNLDGAIQAFKRASNSKDKRSADFAKSWIRYLRDEKARRQALNASLI